MNYKNTQTIYKFNQVDLPDTKKTPYETSQQSLESTEVIPPQHPLLKKRMLNMQPVVHFYLDLKNALKSKALNKSLINELK